MEKRVKSLVFRRMTYADFRHINKIGGEEVGGGGQSYIDFPTADIKLDKWFEFLGNNTDSGAGGRPVWEFEIKSFALNAAKNLKIYQRRAASVSIASQKIHSSQANRVPAWHPDNGFPKDYNSAEENLVIYIVKTYDNQFYAGWFLQDQVPSTWVSDGTLERLFTEDSAGYLKFKRKLFVDTNNSTWPFHFTPESIANDIPTEEDIETDQELEDTSPALQELIESGRQPETVERIFRIKKRNNRLVRNLKQLYNGHCQITGKQYTFVKQNGEYYSEVHHLIPLGENGSDSYANAIVVSPLIHRMLHYADVSDIDLSLIRDNKLTITINNENYEITWHPDHMRVVEESLAD